MQRLVRSTLGLVLFTSAQALANAQAITVISVGDGIHSIGSPRPSGGTYTHLGERAIDWALGDLALVGVPPRGAKIEILPGDYAFSNPLTISLPGVSIEGSRAATLIARQGNTQRIFLVEAAATGFRLSGVTLEDKRTNLPSGADLVRVEANDFTLDNCRVVLGNPANDCPAFNIATANPSSSSTHYGTLLNGNSFVFTGNATGRFGVRSTFGRSLRIVGNEFTGDNVDVANTSVGGVIHLVDNEWCTIAGNTFLGLTAVGATDMNAILASVTIGSEGHHVNVTGNYFERLSSQGALVNLVGGQFDVVSGNAFGRMSAPLGVIRLSAHGNQKGAQNVISSNQFHYATLGTGNELAILLEDQDTPSVTTNQFTSCDSQQIRVKNTFAASFVGNQFVARLAIVTAADIASAIEIDVGCKDTFLGSNTTCRDGIQSLQKWASVFTNTSVSPDQTLYDAMDNRNFQ